MTWLMAGGSLAAMLVVASVVWTWRRGRAERAIGAPDEAMRTAADALAGFAPFAAVVGADGRAALVLGQGMRVAVLKAQRRRVAAREIAWTDVRSTPAGIVVETGERRFGCVPLAEVDILDVRRLAPQPATA